MRRTATMAMTVAVLVVALSGAAFAALVEGNNGDNRLTGTGRADTIHAYGGEDVVRALSGRDEVHGGSNADHLYGNRGGDTIFGGTGQDRLYGGPGDDHIVGRDLNSGGIGQRDVLDCGPGHDTARKGPGDRVVGCERVTR